MNQNGHSSPNAGNDVYSRPKARFDQDGVLEVRASAAGRLPAGPLVRGHWNGRSPTLRPGRP